MAAPSNAFSQLVNGQFTGISRSAVAAATADLIRRIHTNRSNMLAPTQAAVLNMLMPSQKPLESAPPTPSQSSGLSLSHLPLQLNADPRKWSREDVGLFLRHCESEFDIERIDMARFAMNGKGLCLLTKADLSDRCSGVGDVIHNLLHSLIDASNSQTQLNEHGSSQRTGPSPPSHHNAASAVLDLNVPKPRVGDDLMSNPARLWPDINLKREDETATSTPFDARHDAQLYNNGGVDAQRDALLAAMTSALSARRSGNPTSIELADDDDKLSRVAIKMDTPPAEPLDMHASPMDFFQSANLAGISPELRDQLINSLSWKGAQANGHDLVHGNQFGVQTQTESVHRQDRKRPQGSSRRKASPPIHSTVGPQSPALPAKMPRLASEPEPVPNPQSAVSHIRVPIGLHQLVSSASVNEQVELPQNLTSSARSPAVSPTDVVPFDQTTSYKVDQRHLLPSRSASACSDANMDEDINSPESPSDIALSKTDMQSSGASASAACGNNGRLLWDFLQQLLNDPERRYEHLIQWKHHPSGVFKIADPAGLARLWGIQKNHLSMNYDKMSRALRYYYRVNILKKVQGERHCYQFLRNPTELRSIKNISQLRHRMETDRAAALFAKEEAEAAAMQDSRNHTAMENVALSLLTAAGINNPHLVQAIEESAQVGRDETAVAKCARNNKPDLGDMQSDVVNAQHLSAPRHLVHRKLSSTGEEEDGDDEIDDVDVDKVESCATDLRVGRPVSDDELAHGQPADVQIQTDETG